MNVQVNRQHSFTGHRDSVYALQPTGNPHQFVSASGDGMVVLWDLHQPDQGQLLARLPHSIYALLYQPQANRLIAGHNYEGIHVLDWENKVETGSLQLTKAAVFDLQSSEDRLFVATGDGHVIAVDLGRLLILKKVQLTDKSARCMAVDERRGELAVGFSDHHIRVFDLRSLELKYAWRAHDNSVFTVRYSPDGKYLLSGSRDARLKVWDPGSAYTLATQVVAHMYAINHIDFSPDGKHFVTCSMDKSIKVWDAEEIKLLKVIDKARHAGHGTSVNKLLWTGYQNQLLSASDDRTVSSWNLTFESALS